MTAPQRQVVLDLLHAPRFVDQAPAEIYASLLDEGVYHCSIRTMYRLLGQNGEIRERRKQLRHPAYQKPELLAERPNEVWSWDITKLMGPTKWSYFYLYVILDIFSRRVVGWCIADAESATLFRPLFDDAIAKHNVPPGQLTLHADRGGPMKAKATALLLADLGVTRSHNRPHTSNDNPFSESHFKTLKYQPRFPQRFGCIEDARSFCRPFFDWYNQEHHHVGIGLMTPDQVHYGQTDAVYAARQATLAIAFQQNLERFVHAIPLAGDRNAHHMRIGRQSAGTDAKHHPPSGHVVELVHPVGQHQRVVIGQGGHARAEPDMARAFGGEGDKHFRAGDQFIACGMVLADPGLVIAKLVHPRDQFQIALQRQGGVFAQGVKGRDKGPKFQLARHGVTPRRNSRLCAVLRSHSIEGTARRLARRAKFGFTMCRTVTGGGGASATPFIGIAHYFAPETLAVGAKWRIKIRTGKECQGSKRILWPSYDVWNRKACKMSVGPNTTNFAMRRSPGQSWSQGIER